MSQFGYITVSNSRPKLLSNLSEPQKSDLRDFDEFSSVFTPVTVALRKFSRKLSTRNSNIFDDLKSEGNKKGLLITPPIVRASNFTGAYQLIDENFVPITIFTVFVSECSFKIFEFLNCSTKKNLMC